MRKIIAGLFITLDGVVEAPEKWSPPYYDEEMSQAVMPPIIAAGTHLYGRRSYELFRSVFTGPQAPPHAELMTDRPLSLTQAHAHRNGVVALRYTLGHETVAPTFSEVSQCAS